MAKHPRYTTKQYKQDLQVVEAVEKEGIDIYNFDSDIDRKIELLREIGYKNLRVGANKDMDTFSPVDECDYARISAVVKGKYSIALKRLEECKAGERKVVNPAKKQSPLVRALLEETSKFRKFKEEEAKEEARKRKESGEQTDLFG